VTAAVVEFSRLMRRVAEPAVPGELVAHAINRAARRLGLTRRQAKSYWYGERTHVPADLMDKAREIAAEPSVIEARDELKQLRDRVARLEALLLADADRHRHPHP
jgi:ubiquinone biosynthesis protein UbiJ